VKLSEPVVSVVSDLREVPFGELPALDEATLGETLRRVIPDSAPVTVPVAAFQSAL
jgi:FXSXX-COOH protein